MSAQQFDVIVVGASLAGCAVATLLARTGARVALLERHARPDAHKRLCTHFIQASALPALQRLGLSRLIEQAGGVPNAIEIHSPHGWIGHHPSLGADGQPMHGYNIRREVLDPMVRELAAATAGVSLLTGMTARALIERQGRITGVVAHADDREVSLMARLVVAADGRHSEMATRAGVMPATAPNLRHGLMLPMRGVDLTRGQTSQMWVTGPEAAYVFPNDGGVTLLGWVAPKARMAGQSRAELQAGLLARIRSLPDAPHLREAVPVGEVLAVKDYPGQWRPPVVRGMALVGDAAMSLDYLQGVGCGWAFESAQWLADAVASGLAHGRSLDSGLRAYRWQHAWALGTQRFFINDFAARLDFNAVENLLYAAAARDVNLARRMGRVGARLDSPLALLTPACLLRAAWVLVSKPALSPLGTRLAVHDATVSQRLAA